MSPSTRQDEPRGCGAPGTAASRASYAATLRRDTADLNRQRARIDTILRSAITATGATGTQARLPNLPG